MNNINREEILEMLMTEGGEKQLLFERAAEVKRENVGDGIYLRGLIEYSNICRKNCYYCGIRCDNTADNRYTLTHQQVIAAAQFAYENRYGSVVLQGGENNSPNFVASITKLIKEMKNLSRGELGITLSLGEQTKETYQKWFEAGAHRYLLRIESCDKELYRKLHPDDFQHQFERRIEALDSLKECGYQVGTGVMIGLPYQTVESLADDLLFMRNFDIDMCGMGPYIVSKGTPLALLVEEDKKGALDDRPLTDSELLAGVIHSENWRLEMTYKMISTLRVIMPKINIAATTALQAINPEGRLRAIEVGANVVMPNITPEMVRGKYQLYDNKPISLDSKLLERNIKYGEWGDSKHFKEKKEKR